MSPERSSPLASVPRRVPLLAATALAGLLGLPSLAWAVCEGPTPAPVHHLLAATIDTVQQGFFSKNLEPLISINSGDFVTIEMVSHHSDKDPRMMEGDTAVQGIFAQRTSGHVLTGPIEVCGAEPGDVLEVRILDLYPRPSQHPDAVGRTYGANLSGGSGFLYNPVVNSEVPEGLPRTVTIYEVDASGLRSWAQAVRSYAIGEEGTENLDVLAGMRVPIRPHFGILGVAPAEDEEARSGRPPIPAAISTTGASARAGRCTTRSPFRAPFSSPATRTARRATPSSPALRSRCR